MNLYRGGRVKESFDNKLRELFIACGFKEDLKLQFVELAIRYAAVGLSIVTFFVEKKMSFAQGRPIMGLLCLAYFLSLFGAYLFNKYVLKRAFFVGTHPEGKRTLMVKTENPSNSTEYIVTVYLDGAEQKRTFYFDKDCDNCGEPVPSMVDALKQMVKRKKDE